MIDSALVRCAEWDDWEHSKPGSICRPHHGRRYILTCIAAVKRPFKNKHLSVSRLKLYEQCPAAFFARYVDPDENAEKPFALPLLFGTLLHKALELLLQWIIDNEYVGPFPMEILLDFYKKEWPNSGIVGVSIFQEGLAILRQYSATQPHVDHFKILASEAEFNLKLGRFTINGRIDRVDKIDDESILITDFKSNRMMFSREDVDADIQMSIYGLAAIELYPWAKNIRFAFDMLRHGLSMKTERTSAQLLDAADYIQILGEQTENDPEYPEKLNSNCGYCDYQSRCAKFQSAITTKQGPMKVPEFIVDQNLDDLVDARQKFASIAKAAYAKKSEIDDLLKKHLDVVPEIVAGDNRVKLIHMTKLSYPVARTIRAISNVTGIAVAELQTLVKIDAGELKALVDAQPTAKKFMLEAELEALSVVEPMASRIDVRTMKSPSKKKKDNVLETGTDTKELPP